MTRRYVLELDGTMFVQRFDYTQKLSECFHFGRLHFTCRFIFGMLPAAGKGQRSKAYCLEELLALVFVFYFENSDDEVCRF